MSVSYRLCVYVCVCELAIDNLGAPVHQLSHGHGDVGLPQRVAKIGPFLLVFPKQPDRDSVFLLTLNIQCLLELFFEAQNCLKLLTSASSLASSVDSAEYSSSDSLQVRDRNMRSSAEALVSIVASSGNLNYDWTVFAGTAIGLLLILPFTLAMGTTMRTTVVSVVRYVKYRRVLTLLIGGVLLLAVMATSILGLFLRRVFYSKYLDTIFAGDPERWEEEWDRWKDFLNSLDYFVYASWATNGLLFLMVIFLVYQSWSERKERFFWTTQMLVTAACFTVDMLGAHARGHDFPYMIIPWVWLGLFNA